MNATKQQVNKLNYEGKRFKNNAGDFFTIIEYINSNNVIIKFDKWNELRSVRLDSIKKGSISSVRINQKLFYEGKEYTNTDGLKFVITDYTSALKVVIQFKETGYIAEKTLSQILTGKVKDNLAKTVYGIGCIGDGTYNVKDHKEIYRYWAKMIEHTYINRLDNFPSSICEEWLNFQNFAKWFEENQYPHKEKLLFGIMLAKGKCASSETVCMIPKEFRGIFKSTSKLKNSGLPRGVFYNKRTDKYDVIIGFNNKRYHIGSYTGPFEANYNYKLARYEFYLDMVDKYQDEIPENVYNMLRNININSY